MIAKHFHKKQQPILALILFCATLFYIRIKLTNSLFFGFLPWNLFLAWIPYAAALQIEKLNLQKTSNFIFLLYLGFWLLFFPNAPYIITDLIHLQHSKSTLIWFDLFLIFTYACTGLLFAITSLYIIYSTSKEKWSKKTANYIVLFSTFLCGFGIYLGRFLRFNSWDFLRSPFKILKHSLLSYSDIKMWSATLGFGIFIWILFWAYKQLLEPEID